MYINGHNVSGDEEGMHYLRHLDPDEAKVLYDYARKHGAAEFETQVHGLRHNFTLKYENYEFTVEDRGAQGGGGWL